MRKSVLLLVSLSIAIVGSVLVGLGVPAADAATKPVTHITVIHPNDSFACMSGNACYWVNQTYSGDRLSKLEGNNNSNLSLVDQSQCASGTWNDCISSMGNNAGTGDWVAFYVNASYSGTCDVMTDGEDFSSVNNIDGVDFNDEISSLKWDGSCG